MSPRFHFVDVGVPEGILSDGVYETSVGTPWRPRLHLLGKVFLGQKWTPEDAAQPTMGPDGIPLNPFRLKRRGEWGWHAIRPDGVIEGPFGTRKRAAEYLLSGAPPHIRSST